MINEYKTKTTQRSELQGHNIGQLGYSNDKLLLKATTNYNAIGWNKNRSTRLSVSGEKDIDLCQES